MKRIIYTAVALVICASVFGIADYLNAKKKGTLVNYTDEDQTTTAVVPEKKTEMQATLKQEVVADTKKQVAIKEDRSEKKVTNTKVKDTHYTETIPNIATTEKTKEMAMEKVNTTDVLQSKTTDVNNDSTTKDDNKRSLNLQMFSRAPIRTKKVKH